MLDLLREDTIVALATPPGRSGLGVIRVSGHRAVDIVGRCFQPSASKTDWPPGSHCAVHGHAAHPVSHEPIDEAVVVYFQAPRSYTREDVMEINVHGGPVILESILIALQTAGARMAGPGEFTLRAFLNGRLDLTQAEAVADLIDARTEAASHHALKQLAGGLRDRVAGMRETLTETLAHIEAYLDFPDDEIEPMALDGMLSSIDQVMKEAGRLSEGASRRRWCESGLRTVLVGRPNVGKSSLFNAILGMERVLVSPTPGTTRDVIEATVNIEGYPFLLADTAGLGEAKDELDARGMALTRAQIELADIVILVAEAPLGLLPGDREIADMAAKAGRRAILCLNKGDTAEDGIGMSDEGYTTVVRTSAIQLEGVRPLLEVLERTAREDLDAAIHEGALVNARQAEALRALVVALTHTRERLADGGALELAAVDARSALEELGKIDGESAEPDLLEIIFSRFCIGK